MLQFLVLVLCASQISAAYNTLGWSSCSTATQTPAIKIDRLSVLPMVRVYMNLIFNHVIFSYILSL